MSVYPTREIVDDYMAMIDAGLCTRSCGAARDDVCRCRCGGEFHNLLRDWWSSPEYWETSEHWCKHCQRAHKGNRCVGQHQCSPTCTAWKDLEPADHDWQFTGVGSTGVVTCRRCGVPKNDHELPHFNPARDVNLLAVLPPRPPATRNPAA